MKVVAQSTVADGSPYLHLGYTSATVIIPRTGLSDPGWILTSVGIVFLLVGLARRRGEEKLPRSPQKKRLLIAAASLAAVGFGLLWLGYRLGREEWAYPEEWTRMQQVQMLWTWQELPESAQAEIQTLDQLAQSEAKRVDAWQHSMTLEHRDGKCVVVSLGKDGLPGTTDDIVMELMPRQQHVTTQP